MSNRYPRWINLDFLDFCHPRIREIYDYWNGKRAGRLMPGRADIEPADLLELPARHRDCGCGIRTCTPSPIA